MEFLKLQKYFIKRGVKNFINLPIVVDHFNKCVFQGLKYGRLKMFREMNKYVEAGSTPPFMFIRNADTDQLEFNHENIKSLYTLQRSQDIVLNQYLKLNKIM